MPRKRSGPPYRRVVVTFWNDPDVKRVLTRDQKLLYTYLFTNEHSHPCGVYRMPLINIQDELGFTPEESVGLMRGPLARFLTYDARTEEVFVHAMAEHQVDGKLIGQDNRLKWFQGQLGLIQSEDLVARFAARYDDWNLDYAVLGVENSADGKPLPKPLGKPLPLSKDDAKKEGAWEGPREGAWEASPSPSPSNSGAIQPPARSSSDTLGREGFTTEGKVVWARVRECVLNDWHRGSEVVTVLDSPVGLGAEALNVDELVKRYGAEETEGAIRTGPRHFVFTEPTTLRWFTSIEHGGANFHEAASAWRASNGRQPTSSLAAEIAATKSMPPAVGPDPGAIAEARAWLADQDDETQAQVGLLVKVKLRAQGYRGDVERAPGRVTGPAVLEAVKRVRDQAEART